MEKKKNYCLPHTTRLRAIIWDLDGTIIHFKIDYIKARTAAIKILENYGTPKELLSVNKSITENIEVAKKIFNSKGFTFKKIKRILKKINKKVSKVEFEAAKIATIVDDIDQVLEFSKSKNLIQAIYTYNNKKNAKISLKKVNLLNYFDLIAGRDNVNNPKPHPDHLLFICHKLCVNPSEILVIGDTSKDVEGALNVGAKSIAIQTEVSKLTDLEVFKKATISITNKEIPLKLIESIQKFL